MKPYRRPFKRIILLGLLFLLLVPGAADAGATRTIYLLPVQFMTDKVESMEQGFVEEVLVEEMGAMFWMRVITPENIASELGGAAARRLGACKTASCALTQIRSAGVDRLLVVTVTRPKRRVFQFDAAVKVAGGRTLFKHRYLERGGQTELKYAVTGVLEQLFKSEIKKNSSRVTSIVETTAVTSTEADKGIERADELADAGQYEEALILYEEAAENTTGMALPLVKAAQVLIAQQEFEAALEKARQALKIDPDDAGAHLFAGEALLALDQKKQASVELSLAVEKDPKLIKAQFLLGSILHDQGNTAEASLAFESAVNLAPESAETRVNLGLVYLRQGKLDQALEQLLEAVRMNEEVAAAYPPLAEIYEKRKQWEEAMDTYQILAEKLPYCAECFYNKARVEESGGEKNRAIDSYKKAIDNDEGMLDAYYSLGVLLFEQGSPVEGRIWLTRYIQKETRPDQKAFVKRAKQMLSRQSK